MTRLNKRLDQDQIQLFLLSLVIRVLVLSYWYGIFMIVLIVSKLTVLNVSKLTVLILLTIHKGSIILQF